MRLPVIAIFVICFTVWLNLRANRAVRRDEDIKRAFLERERMANGVRKKSLDGLAYIRIPPELLPADALEEAFPAHEAAKRIAALREAEARIVNLTGLSNTDLKLEYGTANLPVLMEYDAHYTTLATSLHEVAEALYEAERYAQAQSVLEFALSTGTDISACYRRLITLYKEHAGLAPGKAREKIAEMRPAAEQLRSLSRDGILNMIDAAL